MKVVIIGNGIAGNQVASTLRERDPDISISIVSAEAVPEYDPCSLPYFLGGDCDEKSVFRREAADYQKYGIDILYNSKVVSISPEERVVTTETGEKISYDKLVLAHGGDLFVPPIEGIKNQGVFSCKQFHETVKLRNHKGNRAVVIGSGAIGIEAAEGLKKKGYEVSIVELQGWILPALFDEVTAKKLEKQMEGYGIRVYTNEKVLKLKGEGSVTSVITDQREIPCDTVVIATGVVPGRKLAETAGISTERGIEVDRYMQTSVENIYACGDCIETTDACTGEMSMFQLKHNAIEQGELVARNILGDNVKYLGAYAFARAHFFDTHSVSFGTTMRGTDCLFGDKELIEKEDGDDYLRIVLLDKKVIGGQAIGRYADAIGFFIGAMWRKDDIDHLRNKISNIDATGAFQSWHQIHITNLLARTA